MNSSLTPKDRICLPLDVNSLAQAESLVRELLPLVGMFKIGFELFVAEGPKAVERIVALGGKVFLDLKFHDIPNTVKAAAKAATRLGVSMFNVHASGGSEMIAAAVRASSVEVAQPPIVLAVTILTSLSNNDWLEVSGVPSSTEEAVTRLAKLAEGAGAGGKDFEADVPSGFLDRYARGAPRWFIAWRPKAGDDASASHCHRRGYTGHRQADSWCVGSCRGSRTYS